MANDLERSGYKDPTVDAMERRAALKHRETDGRLSTMENSQVVGALSGGKIHQDLELSTTPLKVRHELGRAWVGAFVTKRDGTGVLLMTSSQNDAVWVNLAVDAGTPTCDVIVF